MFAAETFTKTEQLKKEPLKIYRDGSIGLGVNDPLFQFRDDDGPKRSEKYEEVRGKKLHESVFPDTRWKLRCNRKWIS